MNQLQKTLTSLEVAEMVGREHKEVLRDIRRGLSNNIFDENDFTESSYTNSQNKIFPCFELNENGLNRFVEVVNSRARNRTSDTVYVIKHIGFHGYYKIGITCDLDERVNSFNNSSPMGVKVILSFQTDNARYLEKHLHYIFRHKNTNREWFKLDKEDLNDIQKIFKEGVMGLCLV